MLLTSPDEVRSHIAQTLLDALSQPSVAEALGGLPPRMRIGLVDPDCVLVVDAAHHPVDAGSAGEGPLSGFVAMSGETAIRWGSGELDLAQALASGEIAAEGECARVMRLLGSLRLAG